MSGSECSFGYNPVPFPPRLRGGRREAVPAGLRYARAAARPLRPEVRREEDQEGKDDETINKYELDFDGPAI